MERFFYVQKPKNILITNILYLSSLKNHKKMITFDTYLKTRTMGLSSFFKNFFGTAKETANEIVDQAESAIEETKIGAQPYVEKAEAFLEDTVNKVKETATPYVENAETFIEETVTKAKETTTPHIEKAEAFVEDKVAKANEAAKPFIEKAESIMEEAKAKSTETLNNLKEKTNTTDPKKIENQDKKEEDPK